MWTFMVLPGGFLDVSNESGHTPRASPAGPAGLPHLILGLWSSAGGAAVIYEPASHRTPVSQRRMDVIVINLSPSN